MTMSGDPARIPGNARARATTLIGTGLMPLAGTESVVSRGRSGAPVTTMGTAAPGGPGARRRRISLKDPVAKLLSQNAVAAKVRRSIPMTSMPPVPSPATARSILRTTVEGKGVLGGIVTLLLSVAAVSAPVKTRAFASPVASTVVDRVPAYRRMPMATAAATTRAKAVRDASTSRREAR